MPRSLLLAALAVLAASPALGQTVRDSVRIDLGVSSFYRDYFVNGTPRSSCGADVQATWPNVLQDILGSPDRKYGYGDYSLVATEGMRVPSGYGQISPEDLPEGILGHSPQLGSSSSGPPGCDLGSHVGQVQYRINGGTGPLGGRPFRITEWYATFRVPSGTPIALFEWESADGLAIAFDASFESGQSREVDADAPGSKRPVASYAWNFGDGDRGSGARPTHTYDEPGEYTVRLVVTDDDGEEAAREEVVTVEAAQLTVDILSATERVILGDTISVVARVTNSGAEPVYAVRAQRSFSRTPRVPDEVFDPAGQIYQLEIDSVPFGEGEEDHVYSARLDPGESVDVMREYVVERTAQFRIYGETSFAPQEVYVDWTGVAPVRGETPEIDSVEVRQPCGERDARCSPTLVTFPVVEAEVTGELAFATVGDGGAVTAGLSYDQVLQEASFYAYGADGQSDGCVTGCVELDIGVTGDGEPAEEAEVRLFVPALGATSQTVTPRPHGGWLVAPASQTGRSPARDNGSHLDVTTDAEGRAHVFYFTPGVTEDTTVTIRAEVAYRGGTSETEFSVTIRPNRPAPATWSASAAETAYLRTLSAVYRAASTGNSIGDLCENAVKWVRGESPLIGDGALDDATSLRRNTTLYLSNVGINALCGAFIKRMAEGFERLANVNPESMQQAYDALANQNVADFLTGVDAPAGDAKKFAQNHLFLYLLYHLDLDGQLLGVALPSPEPPPVYASFQGDFSDAAVAHFVEAFADVPAGATVQVEVLLDELSALNAGASYTSYDALLGSTMTFTPSSGTERTYRDRHRVQYQPGSFLDPDPDPLTWLQEAAVAVGGAIPGGAGETVISGVDGLSESILGAIVEITGIEGSEINQIIGVAEGGRTGGDALAVTFARPTLFAYPEGAEVRVVARGEGGVPSAPLPLSEFRPSESPRLEWLPGTSVAASYDLDVATDTAFTDVVFSLDDFENLAVQVTDDDLDLNTLHFWRVRATNALGDGPWSAWLPVLVNTVPTDAEGGADAPTELALGAPYPNPTRGAVTVSVDLPEAGPVRVVVFDALGRAVATVQDGPMGAGRHALEVDTSSLPSGLYVVRLTAGAAADAQRLTVVR